MRAVTPLGLRPIELGISVAVVTLDQISKALVRSRLELYESVTVVPNLFDLTRVHNYGAAFGMLNAVDLPFKSAILAVIAVAALVALGWYAANLPQSERLSRLGLSFILGGAAGNLIDRIAAGFVLDFVDVYWRGWHFWAFNVADAAITVGVALVILRLLGAGQHRVPRTV